MEDKHQFGVLAMVAMVAIVGLVVLMQNKSASTGTLPAETLSEEEYEAALGGQARRGPEPISVDDCRWTYVWKGDYVIQWTNQTLAYGCTYWEDNYDPFNYGYVNSTIGTMQDICAGGGMMIEYSCPEWNIMKITAGTCTEGCSDSKCNRVRKKVLLCS